MNIVINKLIIFFAIITMGYMLIKGRIVGENFFDQLSPLIVNFLMPMMVLSTVTGEIPKIARKDLLITSLISISIYIIIPILAKIINKILGVKEENENFYIFMTTFSNIGFMGFPLVESVFGREGLLYASVFHLVFNISYFSYGISLLKGDKGLKNKSTIFKNPTIIASLLSYVIFFLGINLPDIVDEIVSTVGGITSPLAMLSVGMSMARVDIKKALRNFSFYPYLILRQIIIPLILYYFISIFIKDRVILGALTISIAMPVASSSVVLCQEYDKKNVENASFGVCLTTLFTLFTIPLVLKISGLF